MLKILVVGIDGGDKRIIQAMPMPFLQKLISNATCFEIQEDLWSRGWAEILSGVHGRESGAFYAKPKLDGTHDTTQKFSISEYNANQSIKPLWTKLCESGYRVGFMNVPSMMPAPKVNGFVLSGGGSGAVTSGATNIPMEGCYPIEVRESLEEKGYILDTRFISSGLRNVSAFFERLIQMTQLRTEAFIKLYDHFRVQFGFIAYMALNRIQNLAMSEIEDLIKNECVPANPFQEKLVHLYSEVDNQIGRLLEDLSPEYTMLVSDHGQSPMLYSVNANDWLIHNGFQTPPARNERFIKQVIKAGAGILPQDLKKYLIRSASNLAAKVGGINADWSRTSAFGVRYVPGLYINDHERFGGPVANGKERETLILDITDRFNRNDQVCKNRLAARPHRCQYEHARYETLLPDIWIDHPDTYFFEQRGPFIKPNKEYGLIKSLENVDRDMYTGIKGRYPLLCVDPSLAELVKEDDERDLTLAYRFIIRGMDK